MSQTNERQIEAFLDFLNKQIAKEKERKEVALKTLSALELYYSQSSVYEDLMRSGTFLRIYSAYKSYDYAGSNFTTLMTLLLVKILEKTGKTSAWSGLLSNIENSLELEALTAMYQEMRDILAFGGYEVEN